MGFFYAHHYHIKPTYYSGKGMRQRKLRKLKQHVRRRQIYQLKRADLRVYGQKIARPDRSLAPRGFVNLPAPEIFNLREANCVKVIRFVNSIKKAVSDGSNVTVDLSAVKEIGEGAIAMLVSVMKEVVSRSRASINGNYPVSPDARKILEQSGFFKFVRRTDGETKVEPTKNILRTGKKGTSSDFLVTEVRKANQTVWNEVGRHPLLRISVFEMMRNSCDHAFSKDGQIFWHLSISHDEERNLVKFSFVDNGKGIIETLKASKLRKVVHRFLDGADILDEAFKDGIESRTGLPWRGKGLPTIFENYKDQYFKNFLVITNNAFIHYDEGVKKLLPVSFSGTYYYWEMDKSCVKACFK